MKDWFPRLISTDKHRPIKIKISRILNKDKICLVVAIRISNTFLPHPNNINILMLTPLITITPTPMWVTITIALLENSKTSLLIANYLDFQSVKLLHRRKEQRE